MKRKICIITNTRADYSRLRTVLFALRERKDVELSLCVTGSHLLSTYGNTVEEIKKDGFEVSYRIYTEVDGRVLSTMTKSTGLAIIEFSSFFENRRPDLVVIHGDRFEALAAATAASMMNIHVAHLQGGEITGTIDEHLRHAITKLSHFHFPSDEISKKRICQLGENPDNVFNEGCPSSDILLSTPEHSFEEFKKSLNERVKEKEWLQSLNKDFFLLIQHPVTTEYDQSSKEISETLNALQSFSNHVLALWPNIDAGSEQIVKKIKEFKEKSNGRVGVIDNLPMDVFINTMRHAQVIIGNSSSGVREACYFGTPVVNIGTRQEGRLRTENVIDVSNDKTAIENAIQTHLSNNKHFLPSYPYGEGDAGKHIADILAIIPLGSPQKRLVSDI